MYTFVTKLELVSKNVLNNVLVLKSKCLFLVLFIILGLFSSIYGQTISISCVDNVLGNLGGLNGTNCGNGDYVYYEIRNNNIEPIGDIDDCSIYNPTFYFDIYFPTDGDKQNMLDALDNGGQYFEFSFAINLANDLANDPTVNESDYFLPGPNIQSLSHTLDLRKVIDELFEPGSCASAYIKIAIPVHVKYIPGNVVIPTIGNSFIAETTQYERPCVDKDPFNSVEAIGFTTQIPPAPDGFSAIPVLDISVLFGNPLLPPGIACSNAQPTISINSSLVIDQNYCFSNNGSGTPQDVIFLADGIHIEIPTGRQLTISSDDMTTCDNAVWDGITVKQGGTLIMDNAAIENASTAISVESGGNLIMNGSEIRNNGKGIVFESPGSGTASTQIADCSFYSNANSKVTSNAFTGIELYNFTLESPIDNCHFYDLDLGVILNNNSSVSITQSDLFNLNNGIKANDNCDINVESSTFLNMTQAIEATQSSYARVNSSEFDNVSGIPSTAINAKRGAVHVGNTSRLSFKGLGGTTASDPTFVSCPFPFTGWGLSSIQVSETRIPSSTVALGNYVGSNVFVTDCHFTSDETTIDLALAISNFNVFDNNTLISSGQPTDAVIKSQNLSQPISFISNNTIEASNDCGDGLLMLNANPLYLTENVFDLTSNGFDEASGADLEFVTGNARCNNFIGAGNGNNKQDGMEASTVTGTISCNVFDNNDYGYQTLVTGGIDMVANEFKDQYIGLYLERGTEISTQNHRGNTWTGSFDVDGAQNLNTIADIALNSQFTVDDKNPVDGLPTFYTPSGANWFKYDPFTGTLPTCPSDCAPELADPDEILGDITEKIGFWLDYVQPAQDHPYYDAELFNQRSDLYSRLKQVDNIPAALSSFYTSYVQTDEAQLVDLIDDMPTLIEPNGLGDLNNAILADSLLLRNYLDSTIQSTIELDTQAISQWQQDLNAVTTTSNAASNVKDMLQMQTIKVLNPLYEYSSQEWNDITSLAASCPSTDGYGVYLARTITMSLSNIKYDDIALCATANQSRSTQRPVQEEMESLLVSPNPGLNYIRIAVPEELKGKTLKVFNIHGKTIKEIDINSANLILDISNYQAGNYILQSGRFVERFIKISE